MVNTRKKVHIPPTGEVGLNSGDLSDSSTVSTTSNTPRRSTRRSVGNNNAQSLQEAEVTPIPLRRSRRLSNSSVESFPATNNDTPQTLARRTIRAKTGGSTDSDVELLVIKRRKLAESGENLRPIMEEKTEADSTKDEPGVVEPNASEAPSNKSLEDAIMKEEIEVFETPSTSPVVPITIEETKGHKVTTSPTYDAAKAEETEAQEPPISFETEKKEPEIASIALEVAEIQSVNLNEKTDAPQQAVNENNSIAMDEDVAVIAEKDVTNPEKPEELEPVLAEKAGETASKPDLPPKTSIHERLMKIAESSSEYLIVKKSIKLFEKPKELGSVLAGKAGETASNSFVTKPALPPTTSIHERLIKIAESSSLKPIKPAKKPKPSLPCGADIMRNIPRGKSKSGREWKDPKSNPRYLYQDKGLKMPFEKITQLRMERKRVKELENRLKEEERARRAEITRRREINKKREEENARRGEIVQVIRNTNKIKRMKKKQLKLIQKRDTTSMV